LPGLRPGPRRKISRSFPFSPPHLRTSFPYGYWTLNLLAFSSSLHASMRFLFVEPAFCPQLPSDSTSRWTPLPLS
jgi:hypothetical protein